MPEPDCSLCYHINAAAMRGFTTFLLTEPVSRRSTFVGGTFATPSALLVMHFFCFLDENVSHVVSKDVNNKNLAIANRSRVSCAHNKPRASMTP